MQVWSLISIVFRFLQVVISSVSQKIWKLIDTFFIDFDSRGNYLKHSLALINNLKSKTILLLPLVSCLLGHPVHCPGLKNVTTIKLLHDYWDTLYIVLD